MKITGNTILITGGSAGIGLGLTERFLKEKNNVIICGRNAKKLNDVKLRFPEVHTMVCDVADEKARIAMYDEIIKEFPSLNVLINNAGIQLRTNFMKTQESWSYYNPEIVTNIAAPIHLISLFLPHLVKQKNAEIINVSSGLAFAPMAAAPIYCATKAALHSFTISLRYQLAGSGVGVIEIIPPAVATDLGGPSAHNHATSVDEFTEGVFKGLEENRLEIGYGMSEKLMRMNREESDAATKGMNERIPY